MTDLFGDTHAIWEAAHHMRSMAAALEQQRNETRAILSGLTGWVARSADIFRFHVEGTDRDLEGIQYALSVTGQILFRLHDELVALRNEQERRRVAVERLGAVVDPLTYELLSAPNRMPELSAEWTHRLQHGTPMEAVPGMEEIADYTGALERMKARARTVWSYAVYDLRALHVPFLKGLVSAALGGAFMSSLITAPQSAIGAVENSKWLKLSEAERKAIANSIQQRFMPTRAEQKIVGALATDVQTFAGLVQRAADESRVPSAGKQALRQVNRALDRDLFRRLPVVGAAGATVGFANDVEDVGVVRSVAGNYGSFVAGEFAAGGAAVVVTAAGGSALAIALAAGGASYVAGTTVHSLVTRKDLSEFLDHHVTQTHFLGVLAGERRR